jgi:hypothetical protein
VVEAATGLRIVDLPPVAPELNSIRACTGFEAAIPGTAGGDLKAAMGTREGLAQLDLTPRAIESASSPRQGPELTSIPACTGFEAAIPGTAGSELKAALGTREDLARLDLTPRVIESAASSRQGPASIPALETAPLQSVPGPAVLGAAPEVCERLLSLLVSFAAQGSETAPLQREVRHQWPSGDLAAPRYRGDLTTPAELTGVPDGFDTDDRGLAPLQHLLRFMPSRKGWAAMAIPMALVLFFLSSRGGGPRLESTAVDPPAAAAEDAPRSGKMSLLRTSLNVVRRNISERAGLELLEDFRSGLSQWQGDGDWAETWSYDQSGFARAGALAIYSPTIGLSDYHFEFLGQIENKSVGWVFRASDTGNYYAAKIVLTRAGRLPSAALVHYAVIDGKEGPRTQTQLPFQVQNDTLYRVKVDVVGSNFTVVIQDQVVETWSDNRHKKGGIGFFNSKAERSLLRWVSVSHQYDTLGRVCALLAPYSLQSRNGE